MIAIDIDAARVRADVLRSDIEGIDAQLAIARDEVALGRRDPDETLTWKRSAVAAKNYKTTELRALKTLISADDKAPLRKWLRTLVEIAEECEEDLDPIEIETLDAVKSYLNPGMQTTEGGA